MLLEGEQQEKNTSCPNSDQVEDDDEAPDQTPPSSSVVNESWLGKLGSYDEALQRHRRRLDTDPADGEAVLGAVKCLTAWERGEKLVTY